MAKYRYARKKAMSRIDLPILQHHLPYPHSAKEPLGGVAERGPGGTQ